MEIVLSEIAIDHLSYWKKINKIATIEKIKSLKNAILENPYHGIGKPEQLKHTLTGKWSRRMN